MSKVAIVTDSTAYIPQTLIGDYPITVLPQVLVWGNETFRDGVDIQPVEFYKRLKNTTIMPSSSQVSPAEFEKAFRELLAQGYEVLAITVSTLLSGTMDLPCMPKRLWRGSPLSWSIR